MANDEIGPQKKEEGKERKEEECRRIQLAPYCSRILSNLAGLKGASGKSGSGKGREK